MFTRLLLATAVVVAFSSTNANAQNSGHNPYQDYVDQNGNRVVHRPLPGPSLHQNQPPNWTPPSHHVTPPVTWTPPSHVTPPRTWTPPSHVTPTRIWTPPRTWTPPSHVTPPRTWTPPTYPPIQNCPHSGRPIHH